MRSDQTIRDVLEKLIADGSRLVERTFSGNINDPEGLRRWSNELILFNSLCGDMVKPWRERLIHNGYIMRTNYLQQPLSALITIRDALDAGLLVRFEDLVYAEAFSDLFEQGQYLLSQGYDLAAGVIFRAVLEERLRRLCVKSKCMPTNERPAINDLNVALYKHDPPVYDKSMMLNITALAAVGNDAAHNSPDLKKDDVKRLMEGVLAFLQRFST